MTDDTRQDYILRITQANSTALVVILYDMFLDYGREVLEAEPGSDEFRTAIRHTRGCLSELINSLHMEQEAAKDLYSIYRFVERRLIMADIRRTTEELPRCMEMIRKLRDAYAESVKDDHSAPLMQNTDIVYAGMTYGPGEINLSGASAGTNRGYLV
ncbi:MAG: flagellar protein FliS [Lachnospiraceae bacterium]|nr:flagellar protein FliS [Lachnospiraceae bacterium]